MRTHHLDGYIGWAEWGRADRQVLVLGHLDVVPVGPGWKHQPFGAELEDGYVFARGAVDDKGPSMAAFFAARALMAVAPDLPMGIRVAFGCNEESGMRCAEHYVQHEPPPTYGVAPDSGWPLYHAEKGIANFAVECPLPKGDFALLEVSGGQRPNIVIDTCSARVQIAPRLKAKVVEALAEYWDRNLDFSWEEDVLCIQARGKAAHGAHPFGGDSAAIRVFRLLVELAPLDCEHEYHQLFSILQPGGDGLGIAGADEVTGALTCNLGIVQTQGESLVLTFNVRYPVDWSGEVLRQKLEKRLVELPGYGLTVMRDSKPLYFPLDHPMVRAICEVHEAETGESKKPGAMGGGTYARMVANTVSIGTGWAGDGPAHGTDEKLKIEHLHRMARIYAHILHRLATLG